MKTSQKGIELIKSFESCRLDSYKAVSTEKYYTIGYGHYSPSVKENQTITKIQAEELLKHDLERFETAINNFVRVSLNQNQFDALISFAFNVGVNAFKNSTLLELINKKHFEQAKSEFKKWNKSGGVVLNGLIRRRKEEEFLFGTHVPVVVKNTKNYRVVHGDTLSKLAVKFHTTVKELMKLNKSIKDKDELYTNQIIKIPLK